MALQQTHLFSLYTPTLKLSSWSKDQTISLQDSDLIHRMIKVLRFGISDECVLFDTQVHAQIKIQEISKKNILIQVLQIQVHQSLQPEITFFLPLLKKEALEQAVYVLCEMGINNIQLVITQKSRQQLLHEKEFVRLQNIVIAAAEQSKNYAMSKLYAPEKLTKILPAIPDSERESKPFNIVFDPAGMSFFELQKKIVQKSIGLLIGPEGGLTDQELAQAQNGGFVSCALTPTILTAIHAVALSAGLFRLKKGS